MKKILRKLKWGGLLSLVLTGTVACGNTNKNKDTNTETGTTQAEAPVFNEDSAYSYVAAQCEFGPRVPNTEAHRMCGDYIAEKFTSFGAVISNQYADLKAYDGTILKSRNIIASYNPDAKARILICGHWDSRPWADNDPNPENHTKPVMGANDAASGIGIMLELARQLKQKPVEIGIDFICFDAEDYGTSQNEESWCLGSQHWARNPHIFGYKANFGILLDMVGGRGCTFSKEGFSKQYASQVVDMVWNTAAQLGYSNYFLNQDGGYITDDHVPVNQYAQIPCINIVPYFTDGPSGFGPTWHTVNDTMENIDKNVLKAVGQTVLQVIYNVNE